jgi:hypothetical protein
MASSTAPPLAAVLAVLFAASTSAQAPPAPALQPPAATDATLAQVMRGIMFPNSNIIFDVQTNDPGVERKLGDAGGGALATFANIYAGWEVVQNAALVLEEVPDLILRPGRLCSNGKPVPLARPDFQKYALGLRDAARVVYRAALEKDKEKVSDATGQLIEACLNCHAVYRTSPPGGASRCVPNFVEPNISDRPRPGGIGR